jgi:hypothetical protein
VGCDQLPIGAHGKEGVDGSSPSEGSTKGPHVGAFSFRPICSVSNVQWVWSCLWSFRVKKSPSETRPAGQPSSGGLKDRLGMPRKKRRIGHRIRPGRSAELLAFEGVVGVSVGELFAEARTY